MDAMVGRLNVKSVFLFRWFAFALEITAWYATSSISTFLIINSKGEKIFIIRRTSAPTTVTNTTVSSMVTITAAVAWRAILLFLMLQYDYHNEMFF